MNLGLSEGIAALSAIITLLAAVAAGKSANSAESAAASAIRANDLAQHNERLAIYKSLQKFHFELRTRFDSLPMSALLEFHDAANISEFYFPQDVSTNLSAIVLSANDFLAMRDRCNAYNTAVPAEVESLHKGIETLKRQGKQLEDMCRRSDDELRKHLRLEPKPVDDA